MGDLAHVTAVALGVVDIVILLALVTGVALRKSNVRRHRKIARSRRSGDTRIELTAGETGGSRRRRHRRRPRPPKIDLFGNHGDDSDG